MRKFWCPYVHHSIKSILVQYEMKSFKTSSEIFFFLSFLPIVKHKCTLKMYTVLLQYWKALLSMPFVEGFTSNIGVKINSCNLLKICNCLAVIAATSLIRDSKSLESTAFSWAIFSILTEFSKSRLSRPMTSSFSSRISFLLNNSGDKTNRWAWTAFLCLLQVNFLNLY